MDDLEPPLFVIDVQDLLAKQKAAPPPITSETVTPIAILSNFTCQECGTPCENEAAFLTHKNSQSIDKNHICMKCDTTFHFKYDLINHLSRDHCYGCNDCEKLFTTKTSLVFHLKAHKMTRMQTLHGSDEVKLKAHAAKVHSTELGLKSLKSLLHEIKYCKKQYTEMETEVENKIDSKTEQKCTKCENVFQSLQSLKFHEVKHCKKPETEIETEVENKIDSKTETGTQKETENKELRCEICSKTHETIKGLRAHIFRLHPADEKVTYPCFVCKKMCRTSHEFIRHYYAHHFISPYQCTKCFAAFPNAGKLQKHSVIPHLHKCSNCENSFINVNKLVNHNNIKHALDGKRWVAKHDQAATEILKDKKK
jgi:hypothetical protein